jgi:hypothetical protein
MKKIIFFVSILFCFYFMVSCGESTENKSKQADSVKKEVKKELKEKHKKHDSIKKNKKVVPLKEKEYTAKYICPDHCKGSGSDKPGVCVKCGMELIENPDFKK